VSLFCVAGSLGGPGGEKTVRLSPRPGFRGRPNTTRLAENHRPKLRRATAKQNEILLVAVEMYRDL